MFKYFVFVLSREGFDDGNGNLVSLGDHLEYLKNEGGSWDMDASLEATDYQSMKTEVRNSFPNARIAVVDESQMRVVYISRGKRKSLQHDIEPSF
ncbi:hypothetical protein AB4254_08595 [Vibrio breoganii]